jgi:hypothetical protein
MDILGIARSAGRRIIKSAAIGKGTGSDDGFDSAPVSEGYMVMRETKLSEPTLLKLETTLPCDFLRHNGEAKIGPSVFRRTAIRSIRRHVCHL